MPFDYPIARAEPRRADQLQGIGSRILRDSVKAGMHRRTAEPGSAEDA